MKLVIGNKNYSTWSLRPWLLLNAFAVEYEEIQISLYAEGLTQRLSQYSSSCRVPVLIDGNLTVWDSLAICEYVSERYLAGKGWHENIYDRALARAICAEMHSGFAALRNELPMNCRAMRKVEPSAQALKDIDRIDDIWSQYARPDTEDNYRLLGQFSIVDCFFAPVVMRFKTYNISLSDAAQCYMDSMLKLPSLQQWMAQALIETEIIAEDEAGVDV